MDYGETTITANSKPNIIITILYGYHMVEQRVISPCSLSTSFPFLPRFSFFSSLLNLHHLDVSKYALQRAQYAHQFRGITYKKYATLPLNFVMCYRLTVIVLIPLHIHIKHKQRVKLESEITVSKIPDLRVHNIFFKLRDVL